MESRGDQEFLAGAVKQGFLQEEDLPEILAEREEVEAFQGRAVPVAHLLLQRQWLTPEQMDRVVEATGRRILLCPACWARINVFSLKPEQLFLCSCCKARVLVPADAHAEVLLRESAARAAKSSREPAGGSGGDAVTIRRIAHRNTFEVQGFQVLEEVGAGGMGVVYRAIQQPINRTVAIKVLHGGLRHDPQVVRRFFREARYTARVEHPNVVAVHHAGFSGGFHFLVLQWIAGRNLREVSAAEGPMRPLRALNLCIDAAKGLEAIHRANLVHRDVKPSNLLLRADGTACVTDFGLVRSSVSGGSMLTKTGDLVGTINYMPPEQLNDARQAGPASDVYSLGATLFHLLCGFSPFSGESLSSAALKLVRGQIPQLDARALKLPPPVAALVKRMMSPEPGPRPQSMTEAEAELSAALRASLGDSPGGARPDRDTHLPEEE
ncbi:MAG: serine/threonine protein kinase [Planctomycetes bacterium]|nr:serine/threonine protein kinase [Planctomycetota bacterium]